MPPARWIPRESGIDGRAIPVRGNPSAASTDVSAAKLRVPDEFASLVYSTLTPARAFWSPEAALVAASAVRPFAPWLRGA